MVEDRKLRGSLELAVVEKDVFKCPRYLYS
jgi:hypothetical protein